jgi:hypothetical protein
MPWELGLGDRIINYPHVAVLPLTNNPNTWNEQEYGKLYGRIEKEMNYRFESVWYIIFPNGTRKELKDWLAN